MSDIKTGDKVTVYFSTHPCIYGRVKYTPVATGDAFHIERKTDGKLIYVQQYDYMEKENE